MSLVVWLPLTKDLRQQGLDNIAITNNGATFNSAGKLGGCYYFNGKSLYNSNFTFDSNIYSLCYWVKYDAIPSSSNWYHITLNGSTSNDYKFILGGYSSNGTTGVFRCNFAGDCGNIQLNTWYHVCATYNGTQCKIYINGELLSTFNFTTPSNSAKHLVINGRSTNDSGTTFNGVGTQCYLNDVRIYNHCLSPMEVKELAKGLVLHYPFSTGDLINRNTLTQEQYLKSDGTVAGTSGWCYTDYIPVNSNDHYLGIGLSAGGSGTYAILYDSSKTKTRALLLTANQSLVVDTTATEKYIRLSIRKIANELNTTAKFLYIGTTEYDCSGFCNNGIKTGTFNWSNDTPKYNVSTNATGGASTYLVGPVLPAEAKTVALWIKCSSKANNGAIFNDKTSGLQIGLLNSLLYMNSAASTAGFTTTHWINGEWNHVVAVNNNGTRSLYVNGQAETQSGASNYYIHNADNCWLWNRSYNNNYPFTGSLCDLRVYATALSADDVKSLYQNSAYIDSFGNVYGAVHSEI